MTNSMIGIAGSYLTRLMGGSSARRAGRSGLAFRTLSDAVEILEDRQLLSAAHFSRHMAPVAAETTAVTPRILNGIPTNGFPSVGLIGDFEGDFCTGTLIAPQWVLTAAHCSEELGDTDGVFTIGGVTYSSQLILIHPQYRPHRLGANNANDVALWLLDQPVQGIEPSPIYRQKPRAGTLLTLVGFGSGGNLDGENDDFGIKRVGTTPLERVTSKQIRWVFDEPTDSNTGQGDSGGPAFIKVGTKYFVAGVTSGGSSDDASAGDQAFDIRVDAYQKWIDKILKDPFRAARNR